MIKFKALIRKNLLIMKLNSCHTVTEILFPILLMLLVLVIRMAFKVDETEFIAEEGTVDNFIVNKSVVMIDTDSLSGLNSDELFHPKENPSLS